MKAAKKKPQLYAYLGFNEQNELTLCVSTTILNPVGTRVEKGTPLPDSVLDFNDLTRARDGSDALGALRDLRNYFDDQTKDPKKIRQEARDHKVQEMIRKYKETL